jgi:hypothetical protein
VRASERITLASALLYQLSLEDSNDDMVRAARTTVRVNSSTFTCLNADRMRCRKARDEWSRNAGACSRTIGGTNVLYFLKVRVFGVDNESYGGLREAGTSSHLSFRVACDSNDGMRWAQRRFRDPSDEHDADGYTGVGEREDRRCFRSERIFDFDHRWSNLRASRRPVHPMRGAGGIHCDAHLHRNEGSPWISARVVRQRYVEYPQALRQGACAA